MSVQFVILREEDGGRVEGEDKGLDKKKSRIGRMPNKLGQVHVHLCHRPMNRLLFLKFQPHHHESHSRPIPKTNIRA